jgi:hypothetical protein
MTYRQFWRLYLAAHADSRTRGQHHLVTLFGVTVFAAAGATRDWLWLLAAPVIGYALAWALGHPGWSLVSDFRMLGPFVSGRLDREPRREE